MGRLAAAQIPRVRRLARCRRLWGPSGDVSQHRFTAGHAERLTGDVAGFSRCEEDVCGRDLSGLTSPAQRRRLAVRLGFLSIHGGRDEWSPDGSWGHIVYSDAFVGEHFG